MYRTGSISKPSYAPLFSVGVLESWKHRPTSYMFYACKNCKNITSYRDEGSIQIGIAILNRWQATDVVKYSVSHKPTL
jgi:hypothetical protein